jgi:cytoskeletal protein CcmA (bactofilin family)
MLGRSKKERTPPPPPTPSISEPKKKETTVLGQPVSFEGEIQGKEDLTIEGTMKGRIKLDGHLTISATGKVEADVQAVNVTIGGRLMGNVQASGKVSITSAAEFNGEIKSKSISIEDGAYLKAVIELGQQPSK